MNSLYSVITLSPSLFCAFVYHFHSDWMSIASCLLFEIITSLQQTEGSHRSYSLVLQILVLNVFMLSNYHFFCSSRIASFEYTNMMPKLLEITLIH